MSHFTGEHEYQGPWPHTGIMTGRRRIGLRLMEQHRSNAGPRDPADLLASARPGDTRQVHAKHPWGFGSGRDPSSTRTRTRWLHRVLTLLLWWGTAISSCSWWPTTPTARWLGGGRASRGGEGHRTGRLGPVRSLQWAASARTRRRGPGERAGSRGRAGAPSCRLGTSGARCRSQIGLPQTVRRRRPRRRGRSGDRRRR